MAVTTIGPCVESASVSSMPLPVVASCAVNVAPSAAAAVLIELSTSPTVVSPAMLTLTWTVEDGVPGSVCEMVKSVPPGVTVLTPTPWP